MIILQLNYWWKSTTFQDAWKLCTVHLTIVCIIIIIISSKEQ